MNGDPNVLDPKLMGIKKGAKALHLDSPLGGSHTPDYAAREASKRMDKERKEQEKRLRKIGF